jgi:hypothetical protein
VREREEREGRERERERAMPLVTAVKYGKLRSNTFCNTVAKRGGKGDLNHLRPMGTSDGEA